MFCTGCNYFLAASTEAFFCGLGKDCLEVNKDKECFHKVKKEDKELKIEPCSKYEFYTKNNIEQVPKFFKEYLQQNPECELIYYGRKQYPSDSLKNYKRVEIKVVTKNCYLHRWQIGRLFEEHYQINAYCSLKSEISLDIDIYSIWWYEYLRPAYQAKQKRRHRTLSY